MTVLVTGATGFFGPEILANLQAAGHDVLGAARRSRSGETTLPLDVTSAQSCGHVFEQAGPIDVVVHAAALAHAALPRGMANRCAQVNAEGTAHMLAAARAAGVRRFVFISSVMVYGDFDFPLRAVETDPSAARSDYGRAKRAAEAFCLAEANRFESMHILRMATMYSPDWLVNVRKRVRPFAGGRALSVMVDSLSQRYSLCSRRNGADAVRWSVEGRLPSGIYNVADDCEYSQADILRAVERADGVGRRIHIPPMLPRLLWSVLRATSRGRWRDAVHAHYWKFCRDNLYSSRRLREYGFNAAPDLLTLGGPDAGAS